MSHDKNLCISIACVVMVQTTSENVAKSSRHRAVAVGPRNADRDGKRMLLTSSKLKSAITNGSRVLINVDARSAKVRRLRDLINAHEAQLVDASESEQRLIRRAAMITLLLETLDAKFAADDGAASTADLDVYQRMSNTLRRLLSTLGLHQRMRDVTPDDPLTYARERAP